ncbi:syntaxin-71-like isoform X2 [Nicotiana sylvestris]|uniref:syntaxin-71-like isoform X2 n=1 Tax=Nicotiana sylvestris TaxID=4096 RepID=UPI00388CA437
MSQNIARNRERKQSTILFPPSFSISPKFSGDRKSLSEPKMSVIDIIFRVDSICKKYDKYDVEKQRSANDSSSDAFARLYSSFESQIDATSQKAEMAAMETNRAKAVAMKAEVRRTKARLMDGIQKLQKLAQKKVKGLSQEELETRGDLVLMLSERIQAIPDGSTDAAKRTGGFGTSSFNKNIKFDSDGQFDDGFYQQTAETTHFREEYEMRKMKQDEGLDIISEGLDTLKNLAHDMNKELDRQVPLLDEIDTKVDKATTDIKSNNVRLKENINKIRSSNNFFIDIILICILLGIVAYLYKFRRNWSRSRVLIHSSFRRIFEESLSCCWRS